MLETIVSLVLTIGFIGFLCSMLVGIVLTLGMAVYVVFRTLTGHG